MVNNSFTKCIYSVYLTFFTIGAVETGLKPVSTWFYYILT